MARFFAALAGASLTLALVGCEDAADPVEKPSGTNSVPIIPELALLTAGSASTSREAATAIPPCDTHTAHEPQNVAAAHCVQDTSPQQLGALLRSTSIRLIDVRSDQEVAQGIIPGAEHIPMDQFDPATLDLSDGRRVVLYCRSGRRSRLVGEALAEFTGEPSAHLAGGVLAWEAAGLPVVAPD